MARMLRLGLGLGLGLVLGLGLGLGPKMLRYYFLSGELILAMTLTPTLTKLDLVKHFVDMM